MRSFRTFRLQAFLAFAMVLVVNCGERGGVTEPQPRDIETSGIQPAIADGAHDPRFPRLFFLPPMVAMPSFSGTFDATLLDHLVVEICPWNGTACSGPAIATFTSAEGLAPVRLDLRGENYHVNWHVRAPDLLPGDYRLTVRAGATVLGGADLRLGRAQDLRNLPPDIIGVHMGRTLPIRFRVEESTAAVVVSVTVDPATAVVGITGTQTFTAIVLGSDGSQLTDRTVLWSSSDDAIATIDANGVATGHAVGTVTITANVDDVSGTATLEVRAPDLTVSTVNVPASVPVGSTLVVDATIANAGNADAAATDVRFRVLAAATGDELATATQTQDAIAAGANATISASFTADAAWPTEVVVEVTTDAGAAVLESDETNNTARSSTVTITIPDLGVSAVGVPVSVPVGGTLTVEATIANAGSADAAATDVKFRVLSVATGEEIAVETKPQDAIAPGANTTVSASFTTALPWPREVLVEVTTDAGATVVESDETNNTARSSNVVITIPDLRVASITVPAAVPAGAQLDVQATVANAGTADAAATDARFRVLANGTELAVVTVAQSGVAAGGNVTVNASFTTSRTWPRQVVVEVTTDAGATVAESDETNNSATSNAITLTDPDLEVASVTFSSAVVGLHCALGIEAVVRNAGSGDAPATTLRFSLRNETGAVFASLEVAQPAIAAGASATVGTTFTAGSSWPGEVSGSADADAGNAVPESDETNNSGASTVTVSTRVTVPTGFDRMWVCGNNTSWTDGNNWEPVGAPVSTHNVYVPAGVTLYPILTSPQSVTNLLIESGARVDIATHDMTASGNVASGLMLGTSGSLNMTGTAMTLRGTVPALEIQGSIALSGDAAASSVLIHPGRSLNLGGFSLFVAGNFTVPNTSNTVKHVMMTSLSDVLRVRGAMHIGGATQFDAGTVFLHGNFSQDGATNALTVAGGRTKFVFDGSGTQSVSFIHPASSFFGDVEVRGPAVNFASSVRVAGQLVVTATGVLTQSAGNTSYTTRVPEELGSGAYRVPDSRIDGTVVLVRNISLASPTAGFAVIPGRSVNLSGFTLAIAGSFTVVNTSNTTKHVVMATGSPVLRVGGPMHVGGATQFDAGTVFLHGNFSQDGATNALTVAATGTTFVFDGAGTQTVRFVHPGNSFFGSVRVMSGASVSLATSARMRGDLDLDGALSVPGSTVLTVDATLFFSGSLHNDGTVNVGACVNEGGTFSGTGNNPCP